MSEKIKLIHGDGGRYTDLLINEVFYKHFENNLLLDKSDASVFELNGKLAFTTDSFVVKPLIFPGGDIGKLAVCGTINDLVTSGAEPLYLSCGFIIVEGTDMDLLERIVVSMAEVCRSTDTKIITGDTKVVEKGALDGIFINTSGIGIIKNGYKPKTMEIGDDIIITGGIGEHGTTIAIERYNINVNGNFKSDCNPLNGLIKLLDKYLSGIKIMKDPTRGGLATILNEIAHKSNKNIKIIEENIPIKPQVKWVNELIGLDPLYLACEGRMVLVASRDVSEDIIKVLKQDINHQESQIIGYLIEENSKPVVFMETPIGGKKILGALDGDMLPRIC
jgi:hydrogenase expression/formation protein HypE